PALASGAAAGLRHDGNGQAVADAPHLARPPAPHRVAASVVAQQRLAPRQSMVRAEPASRRASRGAPARGLALGLVVSPKARGVHRRTTLCPRRAAAHAPAATFMTEW